MSNGVLGLGSSSSSSSSALDMASIPENVRQMIDDIREITGKYHGDEEIYAMLKEYSMDPNETIQKLMYLDTFHEVKSKKDKRKESQIAKAAEERPPMGVQRRGSRGGGHGNYGSNFNSDAGGRKNYGRRENGASSFSHRGRNNNAPTRAPRGPSTGFPNGSVARANGHARKYSTDSDVQSHAGPSKARPASPKPAHAVSGPTKQEKPESIPTFVDLNSAPSLLGPYSAVVANKMGNGLGRKQLVVETDLVDESKAVSEDNSVGFEQTESDEAEVDEAEDSLEEEKSLSKPSTPETPKPSRKVASDVSVVTARVGSLSTNGSSISFGQHVTFPNHFQVPDALKTGLTFGSFDVAFGPKGESVNVSVANGEDDKASQEDSTKAPKEPLPSDQNVVTPAVVESGYLANSQPLTHQLLNIQPSTVEQPKQEAQFFTDGTQNHIISVPSYLGLMAPLVGSQLVSYEGLEAQGHDSRIPIYANGNATMVPPSSNQSPPLPTSIAVSPQTVPVYRQTYPPNFFPYGQYISPYYIPPMHQYVGHNGFAPQPTPGNVYLPQAAAAGGGVKYSLPQFKPAGTSAGNPTHIGIQPAGSYITGPIGYPQQVAPGSSLGNNELLSHLKETQIYTTGQLTEGTGVWLHPGTGQEMPTYQMNSMYGLPPQPHIAFSQPNAGAFAAMFPPSHAMTAPSTLLQQSSAAAAGTPGGPIEAIGPPPPTGPAYQQPQQISWSTTF